MNTTITLEEIIEKATRGEGIRIFTDGRFTSEEVVQHMLAGMSGSTVGEIREGGVTPGMFPKLMSSAGVIANFPVWMDDRKPEDRTEPTGITQPFTTYIAQRFVDTLEFQPVA